MDLNLLDKKYDRETYLKFLGGKLNFSTLIKPIPKLNESVLNFEQLGFVTTKDDSELPVFEIHIKPNTKLERNRVELRNLVAKEIKSEDGAIAVYVDDKNNQWRFSFIAIEYEFTENGIKENQTASKRFTYLLGEGAKTRTAKERFNQLSKTSTLEDLKAAFAVEQLNKEFYDKLYKWYEKAQTQVNFPNDEKAKNDTRTSLIRFLTRILFVWFLKEKKLINSDLFNLDKIKILIDYKKDSSFYKAILQNLFFATLNRQIVDRSFRTTTNGRANNTNYLATNIYRYQDYFKDSDQQNIMALFKQTPFLNGGLFECLDREATDKEKQQYEQDKYIRKVASAIRIDGFSDKSNNELKFDNQLFFNNESDLGLIDLFKQYQFTVEESTPLDIEVALDPELLGKVFENLLATYNPETGAQARKATGSFYTPREIVSYMVDESLKQHFKTHIDLDETEINALFIEDKKELSKSKTKSIIEVIDSLKILDPAVTKSIIEVIDSLKILDPAVGSGAYPMGVLQRLVFILDKIDPKNTHFKEQQLNKTKNMEEASKKASIEAIEQVFSNENQHNAYAKKLMLIENCIYGVDIQPIAIQICKLRFFISLTIEQTIDKNKENYGIKALPNLETKFIVANSLLPLGKTRVRQTGLFDTGITNLQKELAKVRHNYFTAKTLKTKRKYRDEDKKIRNDMLENLKQPGITTQIEQSIKKVVNWDLYNQNAVADWFDPEWMFDIKDGFDIVIGNPPYVNIENIEIKLKPQYSKIRVAYKKYDLYILFYDYGLQLVKQNGVVCFVSSNKFMSQPYGLKLRQLLLQNTITHVVNFNYDIFNSAVVRTSILQIKKSKALNNTVILVMNIETESEKKVFLKRKYYDLKQSIFTKTQENNFRITLNNEKIQLLEKIKNNTYRLEDICSVNYGLRPSGKNNNFVKSDFIFNENKSGEYKKYFEGKDMGYWLVKKYKYLNYQPNLIYNSMFTELFENTKLVGIRTLSDINKLRFVYDDEHLYCNDSVVILNLWRNFENVSYKTVVKNISKDKIKISSFFDYRYLQGVLNSKLIKFYVNELLYDGTHFYPNHMKQLPIPKISKTDQQPFINLVDRILTTKKDKQDTTNLENQVNELVYKLYDLTADEIGIIETTK